MLIEDRRTQIRKSEPTNICPPILACHHGCQTALAWILSRVRLVECLVPTCQGTLQHRGLGLRCTWFVLGCWAIKRNWGLSSVWGKGRNPKFLACQESWKPCSPHLKFSRHRVAVAPTRTFSLCHHERPKPTISARYPLNNRQNARRCQRSRCGCKFLRYSAVNDLCSRNPTQFLSCPSRRDSPEKESRPADGGRPWVITAATWKMKGAGVRGSKDL